MKTKSENDSLLKQPSALILLAMSLAALTLVLGHAAVFGIVHGHHYKEVINVSSNR